VDDDEVIFRTDPSSVFELWMIATYAYNEYDETIERLQSDDIQNPGFWEPWTGADMAHCAWWWLRDVAQRNEKLSNPEQFIPWMTLFWNSFKTEFRLFACTKDKKYKDLRTQIAKLAGQKGQLAIMSAVASGLAVHVGATVSTALTPLCAICFLACARIGRESLCSQLSKPDFHDLGVRLGDPPPK
jgi:hypothetical protein